MDYVKTLKQFKDYYSNTLIVQYHDKPKAKQTIEMLVELVYSNMLLMQIRDAFDWKTAVGEQLDIIGKWVGVSRVFNINLITSPKLAYPQYSRLFPDTTSSTQGGYSDYYTFDDKYYNLYPPEDAYIVSEETEYTSTWLSNTDGGTSLTPQVGHFYKVKTNGTYYNKEYCWNGNMYELYQQGGQLRYNDLQSITNALDDDNYRVIIGLKIIYNSINHTCGEIDKAIWDYFNNEVITKWTDNTLTYEYPSKYAQIMAFADYKKVLPAPIGVTVQLMEV